VLDYGVGLAGSAPQPAGEGSRSRFPPRFTTRAWNSSKSNHSLAHVRDITPSVSER
jgi:hypothetical protein